MLCADPEAHTTETFGPEQNDDFKYEGNGVLAPSGKIYFAPLHAPQVLCIDPEVIMEDPVSAPTSRLYHGQESDREYQSLKRMVFVHLPGVRWPSRT